jgi:hypothetical protein
MKLDMKSNIQSIMFNKQIYSIPAVYDWLKYNDFKNIKPPHITKNFIRMRLRNPKIFKHFRIKEIDNGDIKMVIGYY